MEIISKVTASCPNAHITVKQQALDDFLQQLASSGASAADSMSVILDYDLTISVGNATECHDFFRTSAMPTEVQQAVHHLFEVFDDEAHPDHAEIAGPPDGPERMHRFWTNFNRIIVEQHVTRAMVEAAVEAEKEAKGSLLRPGVGALLELCDVSRIPVVILSAGITQVIELALLKEGVRVPPSCRILANTLCFDEQTGVVMRVIPNDPPASRHGKLHLLTALKELAVRPCAVLVGDKPVDAAVARGYPSLPNSAAPSTLTFGFQNNSELSEELREDYVAAFHILATDGMACTFEPVVALVASILGECDDSWHKDV